MQNCKFFVVVLFLFSFFVFSDDNVQQICLQPDNKIIITNPKLFDAKFYFFFNPYKHFFVYGKRKVFYIVSKKGNLLKEYTVKNPQEPGGFQSTLGMFFYSDCILVSDYCKVVKFNYNLKFQKNVASGICVGIGLKWISKDGKNIFYYSNQEGFVRIKNGKKIAVNTKLKLKTPWEDTSMMIFFREYQCAFDETNNMFFAIHRGRYKIFKLSADNLKILQTRTVKRKNFKMADDKKQGVYRMMGVKEYNTLLYGVCEVQNVCADDRFLYVRWGERVGHQSYVDVFDKNSLKLLVEFKLEKTFKETNRYAAFDPINGILYEDDLIEDEMNDENTRRIIKVYDIKKAVLRFLGKNE